MCACVTGRCVWPSPCGVYVLLRVLCACGACVGVLFGCDVAVPLGVLVCVRMCVLCVGPHFSRLQLAAGVGASPWLLFSAIPGWGPLAAVVVGPRPSWLRALGAVPRQCRLESVAGRHGLCFVCDLCVPCVCLPVVVTPVLSSVFVFVWVCLVPSCCVSCFACWGCVGAVPRHS